MRFGVVGLGSMGRRRARDLAALGHQVIAHDVRPDREEAARTDFGIAIAEGLEALLAAGLDGLVISTPPDEHAPLYAAAAHAGLPFFSEASILTPDAHWLDAHAPGASALACASATWRFHPLFPALRDALAGQEVRTVHHAYAGWLPAWHPWEHYSQFYAGRRRATCAAREMVTFELEWLTWVLGPVVGVSAWHGARAAWDTDIDDTYLLRLAFAGGAHGTLSVELHAVAPYRAARFSCRDAAFGLDVAASELRRAPGDGATAGSVIFARPVGWEDVYRDEIAAFADHVAGAIAWPKPWREDRHLSDVLVAAEESARQGGTEVAVADVSHAYAGDRLDAYGVELPRRAPGSAEEGRRAA